MKRYLDELIGEFHKATYNIKPPSEIWDSVNINDPGEVEDMAYAEQHIYGTPQKLSQIVGIEKDKLPSEQKLTDQQADLLVSEIIKLLNFFNFYPVFPDNVPAKLKYRLLYEKWDSEQVPISFGEAEIEFCDYNETKCPFPGYCSSCNDIKNEVENDHKVKEKSMPSNDRIESFIAWRKKEKIKDLLKKQDNSRFISGIYNYCDRWCERCKFTSRCPSYSINMELENNNFSSDNENRNVWKEIRAIFKANADILGEMEKELNIGVDEEFKCFEPGEKQTKGDHYPLIELAKEYSIKVIGWLEKNLEIFSDLSNEASENQKNKSKLNEAIEVIQWYSIFISAKIHRALSGVGKDYNSPDLMYDVDGSAKIALVAIEKSISSFEIVFQSLQEMEDDALFFLSLLSRTKALVNKTFPEAVKFKRPGFDD